MKILLGVLTAFLLLVLISGCAANPNQLENTPNEEGEVAGFWQGLWQGFISPVAFVISLFSDTVTIYEAHNDGNWYNLGFIIGASIIFGGGGGGAARRRRRR
jgi:hypothetical protein